MKKCIDRGNGPEEFEMTAEEEAAFLADQQAIHERDIEGRKIGEAKNAIKKEMEQMLEEMARARIEARK